MAVASARSTASAQENNRVCGVSARLVSITGTRAPITRPGRLRSGHEGELLVHHVAGFDVGRDEDIGLAGDRRLHAFDPRRLLVDGNVEIERTIDDAADDLPAVGHLGERSRVESGLHLGIDRLDCGKDRHLGLGNAYCPRQDDRVLNNVALLIEIRRDVHRGIADDDGTRIGRSCDEHAVAQQPARPQPILALQHRVHVLIGVQASLHQCAGLAAAGQVGSDSCGFLGIGGRDDLVRRQIKLCLCGNLADLLLRSNQQRRNEPGLGRLDRADQCVLAARDRRPRSAREVAPCAGRASLRIQSSCRPLPWLL